MGNPCSICPSEYSTRAVDCRKRGCQSCRRNCLSSSIVHEGKPNDNIPCLNGAPYHLIACHGWATRIAEQTPNDSNYIRRPSKSAATHNLESQWKYAHTEKIPAAVDAFNERRIQMDDLFGSLYVEMLPHR
jgi:hypothetical protein